MSGLDKLRAAVILLALLCAGADWWVCVPLAAAGLVLVAVQRLTEASR